VLKNAGRLFADLVVRMMRLRRNSQALRLPRSQQLAPDTRAPPPVGLPKRSFCYAPSIPVDRLPSLGYSPAQFILAVFFAYLL